MKELYSLLFSIDNTNKEQNFVIDINEITNLQNKKNQSVFNFLDQLVITPKEEVVEGLFKLIRANKQSCQQTC